MPPIPEYPEVSAFEKQNKEDKIKLAIDKIIEYIKHEKIIDIQMFNIWIVKMFRAELSEKEIHRVRNITEEKSMLTELSEKIEMKGYRKGSIEGARNNRIETANKMLELGLSTDIIHKATGLAVEEIEDLKK